MAETGAERGGGALTGRCLEEEEVDGDEKRKLAGRRMVDPGKHTSSAKVQARSARGEHSIHIS